MTADVRILGFRAGVARWVLLVSLALNFLIVGAYIGLKVRDDDRRRFPSVVNQLVTIVGEDRKEQVAEVLRERRQLTRQRKQQRTGDWTDVAEYIASADFTVEGLEAMLDEQNAQFAPSRSESRAAFARAVAILTPEERAAYADLIRDFVAKREARRK